MRIVCVLLMMFCGVGLVNPTHAQTPETAVEYIEYLSSRSSNLAEKYLSYMAAVAHGRRARKMEKRRAELITEIRKNIAEANQLKPYKGDAKLRDAYKKYWDLELKVFNEDYHKIVDMEEIAEQSYDAMEAYMTAQQQAAKVLQSAHGEVRIVLNDFALRNNINILENDSKTNVKIAKTGEVTEYYNKMYLIYFKSYKQESYLLDALNKNDLNGTEQNRLTLIKVAKEGLAKLDTIRAFDRDPSLIASLRKLLQFHVKEAEGGIVKQVDFIMKRGEFDKFQKAMESKPTNKRTQADVDKYNEAVNKFNTLIKSSNASLNADNLTRTKIMEEYHESEKNFLDRHIPR
jgi:hypothetical protein